MSLMTGMYLFFPICIYKYVVQRPTLTKILERFPLTRQVVYFFLSIIITVQATGSQKRSLLEARQWGKPGKLIQNI